MSKFEIYKRVFPSLGPIIFRNVFLLVNVIIFFVVVLLFIFGNTQAGLFLGIVFFLNTFIATVQDINARVILERLQMLTALKVTRVDASQTETSILAEEIKKGDLLKFRLGDQVPCEGVLISAEDFEISEALVTGESDSFPKKIGDKIIAGAIVTSGGATMESQGLYRESVLARIAGDVKKYAASPSSIQTAIGQVVKYAGYILLVILVFVFVRGILVHATKLEMVTNAGALASAIIPQGLVVVITLLFAIGAADYSRRDVLFQEINATEKLGRIKNICIDKTGTLTDNILVVEEMYLVHGFEEERARALTYACIVGLSDSSQIVLAVKKYLEEKGAGDTKQNQVTGRLAFSSWRRYGAIKIIEGGISQSVFLGTPDIFSARVSNEVDKKWLHDIVEENAKKGKRVLCVVFSADTGDLKDLNGLDLSIIGIFVFHNTLREGVEKTIEFFQDRGIAIRVLSGDNANTVRAVAESVGITGADKVVTGGQLTKWSEADFKNEAHKYNIFAEVLPEHKVKLVEAFKQDGFTAMVGDGVNDALAMKKSDLGIAMFDGVPVTRQLADVILMTNSFSDLPGAVKLADHFIGSIEVNSGIYINQSIMALLFFIILSILGYAFPLTPLNVTFINYFTVGFSGILVSYWAIRPSRKILPAISDKSFLKRIMPLAFYCAVVQAIGAAGIFLLSPQYLKIAPSSTLAGLSFILFGFLFFIFAINVYWGAPTRKEKWHIFFLLIFQIILIFLALQIPLAVRFFNITLPYPAFSYALQAFLIFAVFGLAQYFIVKKFFLKNKIYV